MPQPLEIEYCVICNRYVQEPYAKIILPSYSFKFWLLGSDYQMFSTEYSYETLCKTILIVWLLAF